MTASLIERTPLGPACGQYNLPRSFHSPNHNTQHGLGESVLAAVLLGEPGKPGGLTWARSVLLAYLVLLHFADTVFFLFLFFLIYLFLAVLGLRFCARAFSSCGERGPLFIAVRGPLTVVASPVAEHRLQTRRLSTCGSRA